MWIVDGEVGDLDLDLAAHLLAHVRQLQGELAQVRQELGAHIDVARATSGTATVAVVHRLVLCVVQQWHKHLGQDLLQG